MRDVLAFASLTHAIALDGLGKDHRRRTLMLARRRVGRVDLVWIVTNAIQPRNVFIGHGLDQPAELRLLAKERSEEHTSELQSLMRHSYAVFCLTQKNENK